ncbi:MAG: hypothetical protein ROO76_22520 [Terriglobia bacterium]|nr:hypothetical protein [Terriglobia bacterium]
MNVESEIVGQTTNVLAGYLTRPQLAVQLGKSTRCLHRWETDGSGPPVTRLGKLVLYKVESVREWLAALEARTERCGRGRRR